MYNDACPKSTPVPSVSRSESNVSMSVLLCGSCTELVDQYTTGKYSILVVIV